MDSFNYLGSSIVKDGSSSEEIKTRLNLASSAMAKLDTVWRTDSFILTVKIRSYRSLMIPILCMDVRAGYLLLELKDGCKLSSTGVTDNYCTSTFSLENSRQAGMADFKLTPL